MKILITLIFCVSCNYNLNSNVKCWNIFFYLAGDNDLCNHAYYTSLTSSFGYLDNSKVNVFFMCDGVTKEPYDESDSNKLVNSSAAYYKLENGSLVKLTYKGPFNSGSKESFKDFVNFVSNNFLKSDYNALFLWGHGTYLQMETKNIKKGILLQDNSSNSSFSYEDIIDSIKYLYQTIGFKKIDVLGLDACSMMNAELAYSIKDYVNFFAASQIKQNALSWNYQEILNYISKNDSISPKDLVEYIGLSYKDFYEFGIKEAPIKTEGMLNRRNDAISILDLSNIDDLELKFNKYITSLKDICLKNERFFKDFAIVFRGTPKPIGYNKDDVLNLYGADILKGAGLIELFNEDIIYAIINGKRNVTIVKSPLFIDLNYMIKLMKSWIKLYDKKNSTSYWDSVEKEYNKLSEILKKTIIFNFNRELSESLGGLSIRYLNYIDNKMEIDSKKNYFNYSFSEKIWNDFLKFMYK